MHPSFEKVDHRPWPLPTTPWVWRQSWCDLLFAHWPIEAGAIRRLVPEPLEVDQRDGMTWIGVVPFRMEGVMLRGVPDLPGVSAFPELNLRVYVRYQDRPGVLFLSLDAANRLAVWAARRLFYLPYHYSVMQCRLDGEEIHYQSSRRQSARSSAVNFRATYRSTSEPYVSVPGTLEHWLTERYCLYATSPGGALYRAEIHHVPWPLQRAEATISDNGLLSPFALSVDGPPSHLHFAKRIDVVVWPLRKVS